MGLQQAKGIAVGAPADLVLIDYKNHKVVETYKAGDLLYKSK